MPKRASKPKRGWGWLSASLMALLLGLASDAAAQSPPGPAHPPHEDRTWPVPPPGGLPPAPPAVPQNSRYRAMPSVWCGPAATRDSTRHDSNPGLQYEIKVVYVYPSDAPNRLEEVANSVQANAEWSARMIAQASGWKQSLRFDTGNSCSRDVLDITSLQTDHPRSYYSEGNPQWDFLDKIFTDISRKLPQTGIPPGVNYLYLLDGFVYADGGQAWVPDDNHPDPRQNVASKGGWHGWLYSASASGSTRFGHPWYLLHEITHTLGAIQPRAPHATQQNHCVDEDDLMCYADADGVVTSVVCPPSPDYDYGRYDCGGDDYYNLTPAAGSYLARSWNLARSPFMCRVEYCRAKPPAPAAPRGARLKRQGRKTRLSFPTRDPALNLRSYQLSVRGKRREIKLSWGLREVKAIVPRRGRLRARAKDGSGQLSSWITVRRR